MNESQISKWMDYLYDEMEATERKEFEEYLKAHPEVKAELAALTETRQALPKLVMPPHAPVVLLPKQQPKRRFMNRWLGAAAAAILLLLTLNWVQVHVEWTDQSMVLSFGESQQTKEPFDDALIKALVAQQISEIEHPMDARLCAMEGQLTNEFAQLTSTLKNATRRPQQVAYDPQMVAALKEAVMGETYEVLSEWMQQSQNYQQAQTEALLTDFSTYMEAQRKADIELVAMAWQDMMLQTDQKQQETAELIAHLWNHLQDEKSP